MRIRRILCVPGAFGHLLRRHTKGVTGWADTGHISLWQRVVPRTPRHEMPE
jgi:hypothetical protein